MAAAAPGRAEIATFIFHEVCADPRSSGLQRPAAMPYKHTPEQFRAVLDAIARSGLRAGILPHEEWEGRHLALTFDDGGRSAMDAAKELERRGWRGYFFVVADFIGRPGFVDEVAIRDLHHAGHAIGNHSKSHPDIFRSLSPEQMRNEWRQCRERVESITGAACNTGSVPGGDSSDEVLHSASDAGMRLLFTSEPTTRPVVQGNCTVLGRASVKASTSPAHCAQLAAFQGWGTERSIYRAKQVARTLLFPAYQYYVRWATKPFEQGT